MTRRFKLSVRHLGVEHVEYSLKNRQCKVQLRRMLISRLIFSVRSATRTQIFCNMLRIRGAQRTNEAQPTSFYQSSMTKITMNFNFRGGVVEHLVW